MKKSIILASAVAAIYTQSVYAGTDTFFTPLTHSIAVATPNHVNELHSPWQAPAGISQELLTSMAEIEADVDQSVVRAPGASASASMWDMVAYDPTGKYIFIPHETPFGAGVSRYDIADDTNTILFSGDSSGIRGANDTWANDYGAFDPARFTPYGTVITAEEWSGEGRVIEILNPYAEPEDIQIVEKNSFANVSHEGIMWSRKNKNVVYFVDEDRSGSIYKFIASDPTFDTGQTFVLAIDAFDGDPAQNYNADVNINEVRTGSATWVPITDEKGKALTEQDPFENAATFRAGRIAADEVKATPYGRPEDVEVSTLANGKEVLYFTATSEASVYAVEMQSDTNAIVHLFVSEENTPKNVGFAPTTGIINSPDNLAQDALGNIYIIEDAPNGSDVGGDIWFVRDTNNDGVAESVDHFMSIQVAGAEATGMVFNPTKPTEFVVSVQHPTSTNLDAVNEGQGDALWKFDLTDVVPPTCQKPKKGSKNPVRTCSHAYDFKFVKALNRTAQKATKNK
ncbi:MAG: DUF839 domain-containing protein [Agarilytica sp.]